jgi:hypothetical protein
MEGLLRAAALTDFAEVSCSLGYDAAAALRRAGLSPRVLDEPEMRLPAGVVMQLLETAARATNCDTFGLRMAQSRQVSNFGAISLLLTHLGTLRDVLTTTIEHLHLLNSALALQVEENGPLVIVREEVMSASLARQSVELAIGVIYRLCATLMGKGWHPRSVNFSHGAPASGALHRQVFQCPVIFDAEFNGLVCHAADLDVPNPAADPNLARYARALLESLPQSSPHTLSHDVRRTIYLSLPSGGATCAWVAQSLGAACARFSASWTRRASASASCWPRCAPTWRAATWKARSTRWARWPPCWATARTGRSRAGSRCSSACRRPNGAGGRWRWSPARMPAPERPYRRSIQGDAE